MLSGLAKSIRLIAQSSLLGLGAYLALRQEITPGMMIGGSLPSPRAGPHRYACRVLEGGNDGENPICPTE